MINRYRSEPGWRGGRRIAILVSLVGAIGVISLASAGTASAVIPATCKGTLTPKSKSNPGSAANLTFFCDAEIRAYSFAATKPVKRYSPIPLVGGAPSAFMTCEGTGPGFGCGVTNRAIPGTQDPGTTGWKATPVPPFPSATTAPTTCGGFRRVGTNPNRDAIVMPPCTQMIPAGTPVSHEVTLKNNPCKTKESNPLEVFVFAGGEPLTTSFTVAGDSSIVGESVSPPWPIKLKGYGGCKAGGGDQSKRGGAQSAAAVSSNFPVGCTGRIESAVAGQKGPDVRFFFSCSRNIRAFGVYSNLKIDLPAEEPTVVGAFGGGQTESALHQCEGFAPSPGFGCGITNRQEQTLSLPNGQGVTGGNEAEARFGFQRAPCVKAGEPKPKVWVVVLGEPVIGTGVGEYMSAPFHLPISGYGKCKPPRK